MCEVKIIDMVNEVFVESFEIEKEKLQPGMNVFSDLGLDSLDIVDLVVALQNKFKVKIRDDERIRNIRTLGNIYEFISNLKNEMANEIKNEIKTI